MLRSAKMRRSRSSCRNSTSGVALCISHLESVNWRAITWKAVETLLQFSLICKATLPSTQRALYREPLRAPGLLSTAAANFSILDKSHSAPFLLWHEALVAVCPNLQKVSIYLGGEAESFGRALSTKSLLHHVQVLIDVEPYELALPEVQDVFGGFVRRLIKSGRLLSPSICLDEGLAGFPTSQTASSPRDLVVQIVPNPKTCHEFFRNAQGSVKRKSVRLSQVLACNGLYYLFDALANSSLREFHVVLPDPERLPSDRGRSSVTPILSLAPCADTSFPEARRLVFENVPDNDLIDLALLATSSPHLQFLSFARSTGSNPRSDFTSSSPSSPSPAETQIVSALSSFANLTYLDLGILPVK
ncbi:hypothetical protein JCM8547_004127 [Rhodosporidiobolus lusitaniae]